MYTNPQVDHVTNMLYFVSLQHDVREVTLVDEDGNDFDGFDISEFEHLCVQALGLGIVLDHNIKPTH